jgi:hypothetical protein
VNWLGDGADIGAMLTGVSALTAAITWSTGQWRQRRERKAQTRLRNWHGYIETNGIDTWYVRLAAGDTGNGASVTVEVIDRDGAPNEMLAHNVRQRIIGDGMLSRSPTPVELEFLNAQRKDRGYGKGGFIVR